MDVQLTRQTIRDAETLTVTESERLKRTRFDVRPICDGCDAKIETVEDSALITTAHGMLLIHNTCWLSALNKLAGQATRLRGRR